MSSKVLNKKKVLFDLWNYNVVFCNCQICFLEIFGKYLSTFFLSVSQNALEKGEASCECFAAAPTVSMMCIRLYISLWIWTMELMDNVENVSLMLIWTCLQGESGLDGPPGLAGPRVSKQDFMIQYLSGIYEYICVMYNTCLCVCLTGGSGYDRTSRSTRDEWLKSKITP